MQKNALKQLRDELSKLTGFMSPTPIKSAASEAIRFMNRKDMNYPICVPDSPIISAYASIFANSKELKNFNQLLKCLVDLIRNNVFGSEALLIITNFVCANFNILDVEYSLKLIQYTTSAILQNFPDLFIINSFFSISLAFLAHQNPLVSTTAYASFQQMLSSLIDSISNFKDFDSVHYKNSIESLQKEYGSMISLFENPLHVILNLIFCDLSNLSENLKPSWLITIIKPPPKILFDLFAEIVQNYDELFKSDHTLLTSFRLNILDDVQNPNSIPYLVTYIATFLDNDEEIIRTIISQFFQKIQYNPTSYYSSIYFFHCFALNRADAMFKYFTEFSGAMSIFVPLFCTFISYVKIPESPVSFQMKQWKLSDILANTNLYESIAIHEIAFAILASFKKSVDQAVAEFISKSVTVFVSLVTSGIRISDMNTFNIPQQALFDLAYMLNKISLMNKLDDKFETINKVFTGFNQTQRQIFLFAEKAKIWPAFLARIVKTAPEICDDRWEFYIPAIIENGIPATFANEFSNITTIDVIQALMTKKPFPNEYISEFFKANINRFSLLWPIAEAFIDKMLRRNRFDNAVFEFYLSLMNKCFSQKTEIELSRITATFMESTMPLENKLIAMKQLKDNLSVISYETKEGWSSLFSALHPANFSNNKELVRIGYQILNFLVPDYILDIFVMQCLSLIFSYIQQHIDDSISLDCFELLSRITKKVENWDLILLHLSEIPADPRTNIAEAALSTFFSYLNNHQMSTKLSQYFIEHGISDILDQIDNSSIVLSHLLVDIADYSCRNWDRLSPDSEFLNLFIPMLIERHQRSKRDIVPFYLVFYSYNTITPKIDRLLSRSISNRINGLIADLRASITPSNSISDLDGNEHTEKDESGIEQLAQYYSDRRASQIVDDEEQNNLFEFNSLADLVTGILRQNDVKISLRNWIPILTLILQTAPSSTFPSICKSYASIPSRIIASYNMSNFHSSKDINDYKLHRKDESVESIESLSNAVASLKSCQKRKMLVDILYKIIEKLPWLVYSCKKAMSVNESTPIINIFFNQLEVDVNLNNKLELPQNISKPRSNSHRSSHNHQKSESTLNQNSKSHLNQFLESNSKQNSSPHQNSESPSTLVNNSESHSNSNQNSELSLSSAKNSDLIPSFSEQFKLGLNPNAGDTNELKRNSSLRVQFSDNLDSSYLVDANEVDTHQKKYSRNDDENNSIVFDCLSSAVNNNEMKDKVIEKIVEMFPLMKIEQQQQLILSHTSDQIVIQSILINFFDKNSQHFDLNIFNQNVVIELEAIKLFIERENNTVNDLYNFIVFIKKLDMPPIKDSGNDFKNEIKEFLVRIIDKRKQKGENVDILTKELGINEKNDSSNENSGNS